VIFSARELVSDGSVLDDDCFLDDKSQTRNILTFDYAVDID
jgi:hypothetical protein